MSSRKMPKTQVVRARLRREAEERQVEYDKLTLQQKLDRLPPEPHAKRQRTRLLALLHPAKQNVVATVEEANEVTSDKPKKLKAKERRAKEQS